MIGWLFRTLSAALGDDYPRSTFWHDDHSPRPRTLTLPKSLIASDLRAIHPCEFCGRKFCTCHRLPLN